MILHVYMNYYEYNIYTYNWCDSPGNTGEPKNKPKIGALQNACPKFYFQAQIYTQYIQYVVGLHR